MKNFKFFDDTLLGTTLDGNDFSRVHLIIENEHIRADLKEGNPCDDENEPVPSDGTLFVSVFYRAKETSFYESVMDGYTLSRELLTTDAYFKEPDKCLVFLYRFLKKLDEASNKRGEWQTVGATAKEIIDEMK